jgi:predicted RNA-binding Zn-ribbon protein involved in translation (DUF1610 family)
MIRLEGVSELRRLVLEKWGSSMIGKSRKSGYVKRFPCPDCGGEAFERLSKLVLDDGTYKWRVDWESACGYVFDTFSSDDDLVMNGARLIRVEENGLLVGLIDSSSPPPWRRCGPLGEPPCASFGTLCQALEASVDECRLLAAVQLANRQQFHRT